MRERTSGTAQLLTLARVYVDEAEEGAGAVVGLAIDPTPVGALPSS